MEGADGAHVQAQEVAASHQAACSIFTDVQHLAGQAAEYLALLSGHADAADAQKLRTAALKIRLAELSRDRRSREAAMAAVMEAKQKELDRLLQNEQDHQQASAPPHDMMQSPFNTPISTTS
ncbi:hypothetical protein ACK3TF_004454 [Chlorella vulgaris]